MFLGEKDCKLLLDGLFCIDTGVPPEVDLKARKSYYVGVLFEIFKRNFEEFTNGEIYAMMLLAYPIFLKERQVQNHIFMYDQLRIKKDVFTGDW